VKARPDIAKFIASLFSDDPIRNKIMNAIEKLETCIDSGEQLEKDRIPRYYIKRYGVTNLFVLRLDSTKRLIYTIMSDGTEITANIIEIFLDHKSYEDRFGY
jgi:hypothetical protein